MIGTILGNVDGIILGLDVGTKLGSLDGSFDGSNDLNLEGLLLGGSLVYTDGKVLGSDEGIKLESTDGKCFVTILGNVDRITLWLNIGTNLGFLDGSFDGSNEGRLEKLLLGDPMVSTDVKLFRSDEGTTQKGLTWLDMVRSTRHGRGVDVRLTELSCEIDYTISFWSWIYRGSLSISWKYPRSVEIICILWKYPGSMDMKFISWIYIYYVDTMHIL